MTSTHTYSSEIIFFYIIGHRYLKATRTLHFLKLRNFCGNQN